uniref:Putative secreted protein n=1 Tax=Anopheles darlingi TaxID=43151 RepID=A0A2M4D8H3_ANODA
MDLRLTRQAVFFVSMVRPAFLLHTARTLHRCVFQQLWLFHFHPCYLPSDEQLTPKLYFYSAQFHSLYTIKNTFLLHEFTFHK